MSNETQFISEYPVGDKAFKIDALLVLSELTLAGATDNPTSEQLIKAVKAAVRPVSDAEAMTNAEAHALALRVMMSLKQLGNAGAP
jgi:hypothetical protein